MTKEKDSEFMQIAIQQAKRSRDEGGIPIGAAMVRDGKIAGIGHNRRVQQHSQILHAEMAALETAGPGDHRGATMYTTLMPCWMCAGTMVQFGFARVVVGEAATFDPGTRGFLVTHGVEVIVLDLPECEEMMRKFIADRPELWAEDIGE